MSDPNKEGEGMSSPRSKYYNDPHYHQLVDVMVHMIMQAKYTPSEMREAAVLASIIYQESQSISCVMPKEVISWLNKKEANND